MSTSNYIAYSAIQKAVIKEEDIIYKKDVSNTTWSSLSSYKGIANVCGSQYELDCDEFKCHIVESFECVSEEEQIVKISGEIRRNGEFYGMRFCDI